MGSRWIEGTNLSSYGCDLKGNFSMVTHGWADFVPWLQEHLQKLLQNRGGCVIYLNYSDCVDDSSYLASLKQFYPLSAVITKRLNDMENEGVSPNNMHGYGFSMGARIMIDSSINFGPQKMKTLDGELSSEVLNYVILRISIITVCEPANVGFDNSYNKDPKDAAQNVQCIFSSSYAGSVIRDQCHQNWLIGESRLESFQFMSNNNNNISRRLWQVLTWKSRCLLYVLFIDQQVSENATWFSSNV